MRQLNNSTKLFALAAMLCGAGIANAQLIVIDQFSESVDLTDTPWAQTVTLPKYNPADYGGSVLAEIMFTLDGEAESNVDLTAVTDSSVLEGEVGAIVTASNSNLGLELNALPMGTYAPPAIAVAAGSTTTLADVSGMDTDMVTFVGEAMAPYTGEGTFTVDLSALGSSFQKLAGGNVDVSHRTRALADLSVIYKVAEVVPEPNARSQAIMLFGLLGICGFRRRR